MGKFKKIISALSAFVMMLSVSLYVSASGGIGSSAAATGIKNLLTDVSNWLLIIAPLAGGAFVVYFLIRRSAADEMDQKNWNKRITTAIISTIGAMIATGMLSVIVGYFGTST